MDLNKLKNNMTKQELITKLKELEIKCINEEYQCYDAERGHILADQLLLEFVNDEEITQIFNDLEKWYS